MPSFDVVVPITSKFHWELKPFCHLFEKFWPGQSLIILSDKNPGIGRTTFIKARNEDREWQGQFSGILKQFLQYDFASDFLVILMADYWITEPVKADEISSLVRYMKARPVIMRSQIALGVNKNVGAISQQFIQFWGNLSIYGCPDNKPDCFLTGSLIPGLWNRKLLMNILETGWNVWETEIELSKRVTAGRAKSVQVDPALLTYTHNARTRSNKVDLRNFPAKLKKEIREMIPQNFMVCE